MKIDKKFVRKKIKYWKKLNVKHKFQQKNTNY